MSCKNHEKTVGTYLCKHDLVKVAEILLELLVVNLVDVLKYKSSTVLLARVNCYFVWLHFVEIGLILLVLVGRFREKFLDSHPSHLLHAFRTLIVDKYGSEFEG